MDIFDYKNKFVERLKALQQTKVECLTRSASLFLYDRGAEKALITNVY
jgi:hypothetical protein